MFKVSFKYHFLELLRTKEILFWMLIFPIMLITSFYIVISGIGSSSAISDVKLGIVEVSKNPLYSLQDMINGYGEDIVAQNLSEEEAKAKLQSKEIDAYVLTDFNVTTGRTDNTLFINGIENKQFFVKFFLDTMKSYENVVVRLKSFDAIQESSNFIDEKSISDSENFSNVYSLSLFAMLAMCCVNGMRMGVEEMAMQEANQSEIAARLAMTPLSKTRRFLGFGLASLVIQLILCLLVLLFCNYALNLGFNSLLPNFAIMMMIGTAASYFLGTTVGSLFKIKPSLKSTLATILNLTLSGMAGMYSPLLKRAIDTSLPVLNMLNPAAIITNGFNSLFYYSNFAEFNKYLLQISLLGLTMFFLTLFALRRNNYDSI